ncbi:hypothetical protein ACFV0B_37790 [Streptomyces xanthophaeus]|uniref:hypothetical protein n=1 Tax=Streptomyces xanthophaeus TaxID=67385 RepID=UPI0036CF3F68
MHPLVTAITRRDGHRCTHAVACCEPAAVVVATNPALNFPNVARLGMAELIAVCEKHARDRRNTGDRMREAAAAEALAAAQLTLFTV